MPRQWRSYGTPADDRAADVCHANMGEIRSSTTGDIAFDPPATGRIAVKIINHYGDEVLKVYQTRPVEAEVARQ